MRSPYRIYHIEHAIGSGWTPEGEQRLFHRLAEAGIPYLDNQELHEIAQRMSCEQDARILNGEEWGLAGTQLPEIVINADLVGRQPSGREIVDTAVADN